MEGVTDIYAVLSTESEYVAISETKTEFIRLDRATTKSCIIAKGVYICQNLEILHKITEESPCDVKIAANREISTRECNYNIRRMRDTF